MVSLRLQSTQTSPPRDGNFEEGDVDHELGVQRLARPNLPRGRQTRPIQQEENAREP